VYVHRSVVLLVVTGAFVGMPGTSQATPARSTNVVAIAAAALTPVTPGSTAGTDTHVSVRVLPVPTATPTSTSRPTSAPTSTPTHPAPNKPTTGGGRHTSLPKTGTNSRGLFEVGLGVLGVGGLMTWLASAAFRRRRGGAS
jgi:LPXTG-motif cell wall-anchored protein